MEIDDGKLVTEWSGIKDEHLARVLFRAFFSGWTAVLDKGKKNSYNDMMLGSKHNVPTPTIIYSTLKNSYFVVINRDFAK